MSVGICPDLHRGARTQHLPVDNRENERIAIFNLYNSVGSRWSKWEPPPERVAQMPSLRQSLFRGVHCADNVAGYRYHGENQNQRKPLEP